MMKRSRLFHQTSTPISELCVEPSPPSFKRLSVIPPIGKKRASRRSKIGTSNLRRRLVTSNRNSSGNSTENWADESQREASSAFHSVLCSKIPSVKVKKLKTNLHKSLTNKRKSISNRVQNNSQSFRKSKICRQKPIYTRKKNVVSGLFSFEKGRKSLGPSSKGKSAKELEICTKMDTDVDEYIDECLNSKGKKVSRTMQAKIKNRKKLESSIILKENSNNSTAKSFNVTENEQSYSISKSYQGLNIQKEISICDIVSNKSVNELHQKPSASFIKRRSEELQKDCKPNKLVKKTKGKTKLHKRLYRNPFVVPNERELLESNKEDSILGMSVSAEKSAKVANKSRSNETKVSENEIFDFLKEFHAGLELHMKQVSIPESKVSRTPTKEIANDMTNFPCESTSIDSIISFQTCSEDKSLVNHGDLSKELPKDEVQLGNTNKEKHTDQIALTKRNLRVKPNRREAQSHNLELDVITNKSTNWSSVCSKKLSGVKEKSDLKNNKKSTRNQSKVKNQPCPRKPKLNLLNPKIKLLNGTLSYPSTSTPFDSPEVQTRRLSSVIRNLSPVIEDRAKTNANYLDDIEPTLSYINKTYGKNSHPNSASHSTVLSLSDRLFLSMTKMSSGMNSDCKTATDHSALSKSDQLWFSMMKSSSGTNSEYTTALSKINGSLLENTKPAVSKNGRETSEITLFESPPRELSSETPGKDHVEKLPTKLGKKKRDGKKVIKTNKVKNAKETKEKNNEYRENGNKASQSSKDFEDVSNWSLCIEPIKIRQYSTFYH